MGCHCVGAVGRFGEGGEPSGVGFLNEGSVMDEEVGGEHCAGYFAVVCAVAEELESC